MSNPEAEIAFALYVGTKARGKEPFEAMARVLTAVSEAAKKVGLLSEQVSDGDYCFAFWHDHDEDKVYVKPTGRYTFGLQRRRRKEAEFPADSGTWHPVEGEFAYNAYTKAIMSTEFVVEPHGGRRRKDPVVVIAEAIVRKLAEPREPK